MWIIGAAILAVVVGGMIATLASVKYTRDDWINLTVYGIAQGGVYALIALGYTMVYGILRMINFAHGDVFMAGAYIGYFVATALDRTGFLESNLVLGLIIVTLVAMVSCLVIAVLIERIAYRPLRRSPPRAADHCPGVSFFLEYTFLGLLDPASRLSSRSS
jgi:branched-chain amino acid transport system permease protein